MKLALTGATGFLGQATLARALLEGFSVRAHFRPTAGRPYSLLKAERLCWVASDLREISGWHEILNGCDALIHLASSGVRDLDDTRQAVETDLPAILSLLGYIRVNGPKRVVLAGSCFEYGFTGDKVAPRKLTEVDSLSPTNGYGMAKVLTTRIARAMVGGKSELVILRPFHIYGPGEHSSRLIPAVIEMALKEKPIQVTSGQQIRDFVHVSDVAEAFIRAAKMKWRKDFQPEGVVVNICTGTGTSVRSVIEAIARFAQVDPKSIQFGAISHRPTEMWNLVGDSSLAQELLEWNPSVSLEEGLERLVSAGLRLMQPMA